MMLFVRYIALLSFSLLFTSCATKDLSLRKLEDIHRAEVRIARNSDNDDTLLSIVDAAQSGSRDVRSEALWVLAKLKAQVAYSDFVKLSVEDPDFNVRSFALYGIGCVQGKSVNAIDSVRRAINDTNLQVQIEALKVAGILKETMLLNSILERLSSKNKWVRIAAVEALKDYRDDRVNRSLKLLLSTDNDLAVKSAIMQVIEYRDKNINS